MLKRGVSAVRACVPRTGRCDLGPASGVVVSRRIMASRQLALATKGRALFGPAGVRQAAQNRPDAVEFER